MTNKLKIALAALAVACLLMAVGFSVGWMAREKQITPPVADTVTIDHWDTTYIPSPPDTVTERYTKIVRVPIYVADSSAESNTPSVDSTWAVLTYEQHFARLGDVADVWYSGYDTKIDSSVVYEHHTTQIIKQPYEVEVPKQPLLTLDLGIGNHQWQQLDPYVFARATVNVNKWKIEPYAGYSYSQQPMFGVSVSRSLVIIK